MKILYINDYAERVGGTEVYSESLAEHVVQRGHEVKFYYGSYSYKQSLLKKTTFLSYLSRIFNFKHYFGVAKVIEEFQPDIIHIQSMFNEVSPSILLRTKKIPVVMTLHDYFIVQAVFDSMTRGNHRCKKEICPGCVHCVGLKGMIYEKIKRRIHAPMLKNISLFIAPSRYMQNVVSENSTYKPIQIYNGFSLPKPYPFLTNSKAIYVGRLIKDKGIDYLIEAIPSVLKKMPKFKLLVAGSGELRTELEERVKDLGTQNAVTFLGNLSKKEIQKRYRESTVLVVPSNWPENLPTVCIEALSLGKPVVATHVGGIPEIVKDKKNGYLCEPRNTESLSKAIIKMFSNNKNLKKFSENAIKSVKIFDIDLHVDKILECYSDLINISQGKD